MAVHALEDLKMCPAFANSWGHGCDPEDKTIHGTLHNGNGTWECFFQPSRDPSLQVKDDNIIPPKVLYQEYGEHRSAARRRDVYAENAPNRD